MIDNYKKRKHRRIWTFSELYYPEETSTGYFMTKISEKLSFNFNSFAICSQPTYSFRGIKSPRNEIYNGVNILRVFSTTFNKDKPLSKLINILSFSVSAFITGIKHIKKGDSIFVVTNPPLLPFIVMIISRLSGAKYILRIDDVYPDILIVANKLKKNGLIANIFNKLNRLLYKNAFSIIVLGRDMKNLIISKEQTTKNKIKIITNWGETDNISPNISLGNKFRNKLGLQHKFVLLWAGNMGIPHGIEDIFNIVQLLNNNKKVHFLFIGSGVKKNWLMKNISNSNLSNCTFLDPMPRSKQEMFLNSCDIVLSSLIEGMEGVSVPSRMYNIFSAGKPILGIGDNRAELAFLLKEYQIGWNLIPGDISSAKEIIENLIFNKKQLVDMGLRAHQIASDKYSQKYVLNEYNKYFNALINN